MNLIEFLQDISIKGWQLWIEEEELCYDAPKEESTALVLAQLKQHKNEILQLLRDRPELLNVYPLSYGQKALWFLWQLEPESHAYNVSFAARISSVVDITAMRKAFSALIKRHPILRTNYPQLGSETIQQVHNFQKLNWKQIDASAWSEDELKGKVVETHQLPFDLEQGSVMRVRWFICSEEEHILLLTIHHIACDAWSMDLLMQELPKLYQAQKAGVESSLPLLKHSYQDYVRWQRGILKEAQGERLWNYWQHKLVRDLPVLNLATDKQRPPIQTYNGASHKFNLSEKLTSKLKVLAQREGVTFYMLLLASFQVLLYRYTGQKDILVGSPTSGRSQPDFAPIVGYFVDPVVIRADLSNNPSFKDFLGQVRQTVLEALTHQDYPFALLVEKLQLHRDPSRSPIFQTAFSLQQLQKPQDIKNSFVNKTETYVDWGGLKLRHEEISLFEGQFDLNLEMREGSSSVKGAFQYNTDLFDGETIERMAAHFQNLLEGIVKNPSQKVNELPLLSELERYKLLVEWNNTITEYPKDKYIHQLFEEQVEKTPDAVAVVFDKEQLTYQQLNQRANQLAHHLQTLAVKPEVLVGICVERSISMLVGLLGILKAGGAYVPLDPNYPQERLSYMLSDSGVGVLVTQSLLLESLPEHNAGVVCLDSDWDVIEQHSKENLDVGVDSDNLAYVIYTSGSTGKPKGVMITHQALGRFTQTAISEYKITASDRVLQFASINFDAAVEEIYPCLCTGATLILRTNEMVANFDKFFQTSVDLHLTLLILPTAYWHQLVANLESTQVTPPETLRSVIITGEKVLSEPVRYWQEYVSKFRKSDCLQLINAYGPTETTVTATLYCIQSSIYSGKNKVPIGRPMGNTQIYILDSYLQPVPIGVPGELYIGGDGLARGYLNRPQLTSEKFIPYPFSNSKSQRLYKTGDLVRYLPDGNIEFLGRIDNQVKIRGFRIELGEIEAVLAKHPQINQTVVIVQEENTGNKCLVAYVVASSSVTTQELRQYLKAQLPDYMVPSVFVTLDTLPLTPNGKINRKALPAPKSKQDTVHIAPRTQIEQIIANIFAQALNVENIGIEDNFFELGGHSLLAFRIISEIQKRFGKNLPLATLFQNPTIKELALALGSNLSPQLWSPLIPIQPNGSLPPLFCIPGTGGNVFYFQHLAKYLGSNQPFYGLQAQGLDGETLPLESIEEIATQYIQAIQTVQLTGPYFLAGHSFGSLVAFEMANQLQSMGESVAYVGILDILAPVKNVNHQGDFDFSNWDNAKWLYKMTEVIEKLVVKNLILDYQTLASLTLEQQFKYFKEQLEMVGILPPQTDIKVVRGLVQVCQAQWQIKYEPKNAYSAPITFFRAREMDLEQQNSSHLYQEPTWGWNQFSDPEVKIHIVPGNHHSMMSEPHVKVLAEKMQQSLEEVRQTKH